MKKLNLKNFSVRSFVTNEKALIIKGGVTGGYVDCSTTCFDPPPFSTGC